MSPTTDPAIWDKFQAIFTGRTPEVLLNMLAQPSIAEATYDRPEHLLIQVSICEELDRRLTPAQGDLHAELATQPAWSARPAADLYRHVLTQQ